MTPPTWPVAPKRPTRMGRSLRRRGRATPSQKRCGAPGRLVRPRSPARCRRSGSTRCEIISMLMPAFARTSKVVAATPGFVFIPAPTRLTRAIPASVLTAVAPISPARARVISSPVARSSWGSVKEMSVTPWSDTFCTIMSTFTSSSARRRNSRAAMPGWSGTPLTVTLASERVVHDGRDDGLLHGRILLLDPGAGLPGERGTDVQAHAPGAGELDAPHGRLRAAVGRHLEHLVEADRGQAPGARHHAGVGVEHAGDVRVELARVGLEGVGQGDRGGVRAAPPEEGHVVVVHRHALGAADHRRAAGGQGRPQPVGAELEDLGVGVGAVGDEAGLAPGEAVGGDAEVVQGHAHQRGGLALAGGDQHVHLAAGPDLRHVGGQAEELVGLLAHRAHDQHDVVATATGAGDVVGDLADPLRVGDRRAAELLDDEGHEGQRYRCPPGPHEPVRAGRRARCRAPRGHR